VTPNHQDMAVSLSQQECPPITCVSFPRLCVDYLIVAELCYLSNSLTNCYDECVDGSSNGYEASSKVFTLCYIPATDPVA
jgi:hypothetical protein